MPFLRYCSTRRCHLRLSAFSTFSSECHDSNGSPGSASRIKQTKLSLKRSAPILGKGTRFIFPFLFNCLFMYFFFSLTVKLKSFFSIFQTVRAFLYISNTKDSSLDLTAVCWQNFQHFILWIFLDILWIENPQFLWILQIFWNT